MDTMLQCGGVALCVVALLLSCDERIDRTREQKRRLDILEDMHII